MHVVSSLKRKSVCCSKWVSWYLHLLQVGRQDSWFAVWERGAGANWSHSHRRRRRCGGQWHHDGGRQAVAAAALTLRHRSRVRKKCRKGWSHCHTRKKFKSDQHHNNEKQKKKEKEKRERQETTAGKSVLNMKWASILCPVPHTNKGSQANRSVRVQRELGCYEDIQENSC